MGRHLGLRSRHQPAHRPRGPRRRVARRHRRGGPPAVLRLDVAERPRSRMRGARATVSVVSMVAALAATMLTGCQAGEPDPTTGGTVTSTSSAATNPVWPSNFPDPQILPDGDGWVAISTNGNGMNVQTLVSDDLVTWAQGSDALPELASWTSPGKVWAPEAHRFGDRWVMYYTTKAPDPAIQCIGLAVADDPQGPLPRHEQRPPRLRGGPGRLDRRVTLPRGGRHGLPLLEERRQRGRGRHLDLGAAALRRRTSSGG